jgi:hypothetical protein
MSINEKKMSALAFLLACSFLFTLRSFIYFSYTGFDLSLFLSSVIILAFFHMVNVYFLDIECSRKRVKKRLLFINYITLGISISLAGIIIARSFSNLQWIVYKHMTTHYLLIVAVGVVLIHRILIVYKHYKKHLKISYLSIINNLLNVINLLLLLIPLAYITSLDLIMQDGKLISKKDAWNTWDNTEYTIQYPMLWTSEKVQNKLVFFSSKASAWDQYKEHGYIQKIPLKGYTFGDVVKIRKQAIQRNENARIIYEAGNHKNHRFKYTIKETIPFFLTPKEYDLTIQDRLVVHGGQVYIISFVAETSAAAKYELQGNRFLNSFSQKVVWKSLEKAYYSIKYPSNWFLSNKQGGFTLLTSLDGVNDQYQESISLNIQALAGSNLNKHVTCTKEEIKNILPEGKLIESRRGEKNNKPYHKLIYSCQHEGRNLTLIQYLWPSVNSIWILTYVDESRDFDKHKKQAIKILNSFTVSDKEEVWLTKKTSEYEVNYPETWKYSSGGHLSLSHTDRQEFIIIAPKNSPIDPYQERIILHKQTSLFARYDLSMSINQALQYVNNSPNQTLIESSPVIYQGLYGHQLIYTAKVQDKNLIFQQRFWAKNRDFYTLTFCYEASKFKSYRKEAERIINSFRFN